MLCDVINVVAVFMVRIHNDADSVFLPAVLRHDLRYCNIGKESGTPKRLVTTPLDHITRSPGFNRSTIVNPNSTGKLQTYV